MRPPWTTAPATERSVCGSSRRGEAIVEGPDVDHLGDVLAVLVLEQEPVQRIPVPLAVGLEVPYERLARVGNLAGGRIVAPELLDQLERGLDETLRSGRVAGERDRQAVLLDRPFREPRLHGHAVRSAKLLAQRAVQVAAERLAHRPDQHSMHLVVLKRSCERDADLALGLDALSHLLLDDAGRRMWADIPHGLLSVERRQARQIALHERPHRRDVEAADEDEREAARIGEAVLVEG